MGMSVEATEDASTTNVCVIVSTGLFVLVDITFLIVGVLRIIDVDGDCNCEVGVADVEVLPKL